MDSVGVEPAAESGMFAAAGASDKETRAAALVARTGEAVPAKAELAPTPVETTTLELVRRRWRRGHDGGGNVLGRAQAIGIVDRTAGASKGSGRVGNYTA
jgi:hypothetical protein